jgi:hypothetical protein
MMPLSKRLKDIGIIAGLYESHNRKTATSTNQLQTWYNYPQCYNEAFITPTNIMMTAKSEGRFDHI